MKKTGTTSANPNRALEWINPPTYLPITNFTWVTNGAFTLDVKWVLNENLGGILGGT
jgi:hypothetical protein